MTPLPALFSKLLFPNGFCFRFASVFPAFRFFFLLSHSFKTLVLRSSGVSPPTKQATNDRGEEQVERSA